MEVGQKMSELKFKLVDARTGREVRLPQSYTTLMGDVTIVRFKPSRFLDNGGYIHTDLDEVLKPSVIGAEIVEVTP